MYISNLKKRIFMIYKRIIDYHVLYIMPLRTPLLEIPGVFFEPAPRVFAPAAIITGVLGLPLVLIMVMSLLLTFR